MSSLQRFLFGFSSAAALVAVAACGGGGSDSGTPAAPSRPAVAANCPSAQSGNYRLLNPYASGALRIQRATFDAIALTVTFADGSPPVTLTPIAGKACQFSASVGNGVLVVGPSGLVVERYTDGAGAPRVLVGLPEQTVALSELAGNWNTVEFGRNDPAVATNFNWYSTIAVNSAGAITGITDCDHLAPCSAPFGINGFTVNADGGFDAAGVRLFAHRSTTGQFSLFGLTSDSVVVAAKQTVLALPTTGNSYWEILVGDTGLAYALSEDTTTLLSASGSVYTRSRASDGRVDTFTINSPRNGMRYLAANTCANAGGSQVYCSGIIMLPLPGSGVSVYGSAVAGSDFLGIAVNKPTP
jgi:hypothetical protein